MTAKYGIALLIGVVVFAPVACVDIMSPSPVDQTPASPSNDQNADIPTDVPADDAPADSPPAGDMQADNTEPVATGPTRVRFKTSTGDILIELEDEAAPITVANFLQYVEDGFYDGRDGLGATVIHRIAPGFVIQGGGFTSELVEKETRAPIPNEADNGLTNLRGTLSMARTSDPDSGTSQFFVNLVDNNCLDFTTVPDPNCPSHTADGFPGHTVFGHVVEGLDVVDTIAAVPTGNAIPPNNACTPAGLPEAFCQLTGVPTTPITVVSAEIVPK